MKLGLRRWPSVPRRRDRSKRHSRKTLAPWTAAPVSYQTGVVMCRIALIRNAESDFCGAGSTHSSVAALNWAVRSSCIHSALDLRALVVHRDITTGYFP